MGAILTGAFAAALLAGPAIAAEPSVDVAFSAQFRGESPKPEKINAWNRDKRFGRESTGPDQKIWVSQAVITGEGTPIKSLERYFGFWKLVLEELPPFVTSD